MSEKDLSKLDTATRSTPVEGKRSEADRREALPAGTRVGRYVISRPIAGGGMGDVYLARDESLDRDIALKVIRSDALTGRRVLAFLREAQTTAQFSHPNIVIIHEVGTWKGTPFLALEYLDGPTLRDWLESCSPTLEEALRVIFDVSEALVAAHERGIVHRDLKPANIIVASDGRARVLDFGLAAALDDAAALSGGTLRYMAPEQRRRQSPSPAVDIWALGLIVKGVLDRHREVSNLSRSEDETETGEDSAVLGPLEALLEASADADPAKRPSAVVFRDEILRLLEQARVQTDLAHTRELLGRDLERSRLLEEALALRDGGRGGILGVEGEAGLGKTLLLADFFRRAQDAGLRVLRGSADAIQRHTPFHAWRGVLLQLIADDSELESGEPIPESLLAEIDQPILRRVLQTSEAETWTAPLFEIESRADVTIRELTEVFSQRITSPVVAVIDDWHWADSASCRLARSLVLSVPQLLLVVCYRPLDDAGEEHLTLRELPRFRSIVLPPLTDRSVGRIVESRLPGGDPGGELSRLVIRHAAGNPLFAEELTALARQSAPGQLAGKPTLPGVLNRRIEALPPDVLSVLTTASVVGRRFRVDLLERIHGAEVVKPALERLLEVGLIREEGTGYAFWHDLTRTTTYGRLSAESRRDLHHAVAGMLEDSADSTGREYSALADHWYEAGNVERTIEYSEIAADQALSAGGYEEAIRLLRRCLSLDQPGVSRGASRERAMRWRRLLAETHYALGRLAEASEEAHRVLALADLEFPTSSTGHRLATTVLFAEAIRLSKVPPGNARVEGKVARLDVARALGIVATAAWYFSDEEKMHYAALAAFREAHRCGPSQTLVLSASRLGCEVGMRMKHWPGVGRRFAQVAHRVAEDLNDEAAKAYACMMDALYRIGNAEWELVADSLDCCQEIWDRARDDANWCNAQAIRFWSCHYQGLREEGWRAAQELLDRGERTGNDQHRGWGGRCLALQMLVSGDSEGARRSLEDAIGFLQQSGDSIDLVPAYGILALAWKQLGELDHATTRADRTLAQLQSSGSLSSHASLEGCSAVAEIYLTAQEENWPQKTRAGWSRSVAQSLDVLKRYKSRFPVGVARYALWKGVAAHNKGHRSEARRWWQRGLSTAADMGLRHDTERLSSRLQRPSSRS